MRRYAIAIGVFFLITEVTAIGARVFYQPLLGGDSYIAGVGADSSVLFGGFLEILLVFAIIGSGVALYPIVKRQNETVALGYLTARVLEAAVILVGVIALMSVVTMRQTFAGAAGAEASSLAVMAESLVIAYNWASLLGPGFLLGVNSVLLAYLMYRSRMVPRLIAVLGLVGGTLITLSTVAVMFGFYGQFSQLGLIVALPVFAWEVSLAVYLIVKGFKSLPSTNGMATPEQGTRLASA